MRSDILNIRNGLNLLIASGFQEIRSDNDEIIVVGERDMISDTVKTFMSELNWHYRIWADTYEAHWVYYLNAPEGYKKHLLWYK